MNARGKILGLCLLGAISAYALSANAQDMPAGFSMEVVKVHPASMVPGAAKITELLVIMEPGASAEFTPEGTHYCTTLLGEATVVFADGTTVIRKAGEIHIEEMGVSFTITNTGGTKFVDRMFEVRWN
jgi:hypothetical protein